MGRSIGGLLLVGAALSLSAAVQNPDVRFHFREPGVTEYRVPAASAARTMGQTDWLIGTNSAGGKVELGSRVVVQLPPGTNLDSVLAESSLKPARTLGSNVFILQGPDPVTAAREAERLAAKCQVSVPIMRRDIVLHGPYAFQPNDKHFPVAWHLEQRGGTNEGVDLNVRAAWPYTRGAGVTIGFADDGVEFTHPDLIDRAAGMTHYNFGLGTTNGLPSSSLDKHATAVAGLAVASLNNGIGASGVAPEAGLASWKIFNPNATDEQLADMQLFCNESVAVHNYSWGFTAGALHSPSFVEQVALQRASREGRGGRGIVIVRSAGNERAVRGNAGDSGYLSDPGSIVVGSVRSDGRATTYSNPGACLLLATPSGDPTDWASLFTTDRQGLAGYNYFNWIGDSTLSDYCFSTSTPGKPGFGGTGFWGTSGSAPQVSGIAALVLSANTNLSNRDVQQILVHSARHFDLADPDMTTNGAGFRVSHSAGFGIPDAGMAVRLARNWPSRPADVSITVDPATPLPAQIPEDGRRVLVYSGINLLWSFGASSSLGVQIDTNGPVLPMVDVGYALAPINQDLTGKGALIRRGTNDFSQKIAFAAQAGAAFAVIYDSKDEERFLFGGTDFSPIPAVLINRADGETLRDALAQSNLLAGLTLLSANCSFNVTNTLLCERVSARVNIQYPHRADIRITLVSPQGTRSILSRINADTNNPCTEWTYASTHHMYESSAGVWTLSVSDETPRDSGSILSASLTISGVPIVDSDHDGLDDNWEMANFGTLNFTAKDDPDGNGFNNMREQIMGTDPNSPNAPLNIDLSRYNTNQVRLSWPATGRKYEVLAGTNPAALAPVTNLSGRFPETEILVPSTNAAQQYFRIRAAQP